MSAEDAWCTIESDPGVFTDLVQALGVRGISFEEVVDLDDIGKLGKIHGLIFLFKWEASARPGTEEESEVYFAKQVIQNACATQAIISVLLNAEGIELGSTLTEFKDFTLPLDPESRGLVLGSSDVIRAAHNSFRPFSAFEFSEPSAKEGDAFHFVALVPKFGGVFALDGLAAGPQRLGAEWPEAAVAEIRARIAAASGEIRFNLLAVVDEPEGEVFREKREKWKKENDRRRFDYTPFLLAVCRRLAEKGKMVDLFESAEVRHSSDQQ